MSFWPGRSSALGSLEIELTGIGGVWPFLIAWAFRHLESAQTSDLNRSFIGAYPPTASPYKDE